ncbi:hypothetical protein [Streptomyces sp. JW3]|uniref:hypothetical protein n=1 Tax=Streptomyces sp. JW3 TaxID=3456955 RepID=UPI003FA41D5A
MNSTIRSTVLSAGTVTLALLVTACGGGDDDTADAKPKASATTTASAAKALTAAELDELIVAKGDIKGQEVAKPTEDDVSDAASLSVPKTECEPVAQVLSALPAGKPAATVQRLVTEESEAYRAGLPSMEELAQMTEEEAADATLASLDITKTMTSLWSYDADGAEAALTALRQAGEKCASGFAMSLDGDEQQVTKITEEQVSAGEDAVAWTVATKIDGDPVETKVVVFRQGSTLAGFSSFNIAAVGRGESFPQPTAVIEAQAAKLG